MNVVNATVEGPHSLGKLIEWKHSIIKEKRDAGIRSPLAGETN